MGKRKLEVMIHGSLLGGGGRQLYGETKKNLIPNEVFIGFPNIDLSHLINPKYVLID